MTISDPILASLLSSQSALHAARNLATCPVAREEYREVGVQLSKLIGKRAREFAIRSAVWPEVAS